MKRKDEKRSERRNKHTTEEERGGQKIGERERKKGKDDQCVRRGGVRSRLESCGGGGGSRTYQYGAGEKLPKVSL